MKVLIVGPNIYDVNKLGGIITYVNFLLNNISCDYHYFNRSGSNRSIFLSIGNFIKYFKLQKKICFDIIHINSALNTPAIIRDFMLLVLSRKNKKIVIQIHGGKYMTNNPPTFINFFIKRLINKKNIILLSESEKKVILENYNPENIFILRNSVTNRHFDNINSKKILEKLNNPVSIIFLGRIDYFKGLDDMLSALIELKGSNIKFKFYLYGDGEYRKSIVEKISNSLGDDYFYYGGIVKGDEKMLRLVSSDIFVLPSLFEGLPISLLEAMSVGRIVIATNVGSIPSVVRNDINGFLVEPRNSNQLYQTLLKVINLKDVKSISLAAVQTINESYSENYFKNQIMDIYRLLMKN
jgi:glycosyltransferase involved in cell wall biosynthesis